MLVASHALRRSVAGAAPPQVRPPRLPHPGGRPVLRKVGSNGGICFAGSFYRVGDAYRGAQVEVRLVDETVEIAQHGRLLRSWPARHDRFREHGAFSNPAGRPRRSNASPFSDPEPVTHLPKPMCNAGGET